MTTLFDLSSVELVSIVAIIVVTLGGLLFLRHLVRTSGSDPECDPERVERFLRDAPYERLRDITTPEQRG